MPPLQQLQQQQQLLMVDSALLDQGGEVEPSQVRMLVCFAAGRYPLSCHTNAPCRFPRSSTKQTCPHLHACLRLPLAALPASIGRPCEGCGACPMSQTPSLPLPALDLTRLSLSPQGRTRRRGCA